MVRPKLAKPAYRRYLWGPLVAALLVSCRSPRAVAGDGTHPEVVDAPLAPQHVDPQYERAWSEVVEAQKKDPAGDEVVAAADALLATDPPADLDAAATLAKARAAYLRGDDADVVELVDRLEQRAPWSDLPSHLAIGAAQQRAYALARGGDPARALRELDALDAQGSIATVELRGARAAALDRGGDHAKALVAYVEWREVLQDDSAQAVYAETRMRALASGLDQATLERLADGAKGEGARACLRLRSGVPAAEVTKAPSWASRCADVPASVGVLLPRSGRFAALADEQLAAASVAVEVLSRRHGPGSHRVEVAWADSGSDPGVARAGAERLAAAGVSRIIGPLAPASIAKVEAVRVPLIVPGESAGRAEGVAPSLEARVEALVRHAAAAGKRRLYVFAPDNSYGRRGVDAVKSLSQVSLSKDAKVITYSGSATSFSTELDKVRKGLGADAAMVCIDALPRTELIVRQLLRWQIELGPSGLAVYATGEGLGHRTIGRGHEPLEGVLVAPSAFAGPEDAEFTRSFERREGHPPSDQALLVWRAFERAWRGGHEPARAEVVRIEGGRVVSVAAR